MVPARHGGCWQSRRLGGLVEVTRRFVRLLRSALERERLCSGDPVCADHNPTIAQTIGHYRRGMSWMSPGGGNKLRSQKLFLDRALIVDTVGQTGASFFG